MVIMAGILKKIKDKIRPEQPEIRPFNFKKEENTKPEGEVDSFNPTLGKRGSSEGVVIPKKWILLTRLKEALKNQRLFMSLEKNPGDPIWGYRIILEFKDERREAAGSKP